MKTILIFSILLFITTSLTAVGMFKGDTIRYRFDIMLVEVVSNSYSAKSPEKPEFLIRIEELRKVLEEMSVIVPPVDERVTVSFLDLSDNLKVYNFKELELSREKKNTKNFLVFDDGTIFEKEFGNYCVNFLSQTFEVKIFVNDLDDLAFFNSDVFDTKVREGTMAVTKITGEGFTKTTVQACVDLRSEEPKVFMQTSPHKSTDLLIITGGIGSGWVKNTFVSDINLRLGLGFSKRGVMKNIYAVDWSIMYDFSNPNDSKFFELNHFVLMGWEHNFSNSPMDDKWYGFSLGYLVKRNNDFFKENTFRLSVKKKINDSISLKPELYFNNFLKDVYPGIRVTVAF